MVVGGRIDLQVTIALPEGGLILAVPAGRWTCADPAVLATAAADLGAALLVLPLDPDALPQASDEAIAEAWGRVAAAARCAILFAYAEACSGNRHAALQLVLADGRATANCRATHLDPATTAAGWVPGAWLTMAKLGSSTLGLMAGQDHLAPEVGRALSSLGATLLLGVLGPAPCRPTVPLATIAAVRALENGVPVCLVGPDGSIGAAAADGTVVVPQAAPGLTLVHLAPGGGRPAVPRRPELYRRLVDQG